MTLDFFNIFDQNSGWKRIRWLRNSFVVMSDSDEILFDDIYELHEVIGKILEIVFHFSQKACREERAMEPKPFWSPI